MVFAVTKRLLLRAMRSGRYGEIERVFRGLRRVYEKARKEAMGVRTSKERWLQEAGQRPARAAGGTPVRSTGHT